MLGKVDDKEGWFYTTVVDSMDSANEGNEIFCCAVYLLAYKDYTVLLQTYLYIVSEFSVIV